MRVVFIGTPEFSVPALAKLKDSGYNIVGVITAPDRRSGRGMQLTQSAVKKYAVSQDIKVMQPTNLKDEDFQEELRSLNPDIQVVIAFRMLPEAVWNMPPLGTVNLHASLLPDYRGAAPINWAIINGEKKTGLTTFRLKHEIDTGNILLQHEMEIGSGEDAGSLHDRMMLEGADLVLHTLDGIRENTIEERPQVVSDDNKPAPKIFKSTCEIDWHKPGQEIYNLIRGLSPYPAARTRHKNKILKIFKARFERENHDQYPGTLKTDNSTFFGFYCKDGVIYLDEVQLEGKKRMSADALLRGLQNS